MVGLVVAALVALSVSYYGPELAQGRGKPPSYVMTEAQKNIVKITSQTRFHQRKADEYAHKMGTHVPAAHRPVAPTPTVRQAVARLTVWKGVHSAWADRYKSWKLGQECRGPRPLIPRGITVKHSTATLEQRRVLTEALNVAKARGVPTKVHVALVAGITQESNAKNLAGGHGTSVGVLQLINTHGSARWRRHIPNSVNWFLNGVLKHLKANPGISVNDLVQKQQQSAHPRAYGKWRGEAEKTVRAFFGDCPIKVRAR